MVCKVVLWFCLAHLICFLTIIKGENSQCLGTSWRCTNKESCGNPQKEIINGTQILRTCERRNRGQGICCITGATAGKKSFDKCNEYGKLVFTEIFEPLTETFLKSDNCKAAEPLIINGKQADPQEFPHMALVGTVINGSLEWFCGGSLISELYVLSAAHCTEAKDKTWKAQLIRLGEYNIQSAVDDIRGLAKPMDYEIIEWLNHPGYIPESHGRNDIALYKLKSPVVFNEYVRPICLNSKMNLDHNTQSVIATGWGLTENGTRSDVLMKVNLTITPCTSGGRLSQICLANLTHHLDTCRGDSGGPAQVRLADPYCMYSQYGVTSYGPRKCGHDWTGTYMKVAYYLPWIESIVWP